ncbi:MAG: hypothetical protein MJY94_04405 [Bacteroidales bacterium]|nr:hypothetical protein [Bacteroidales bacterium]
MKKIHLFILAFILLAASCQRSSSGVDEALSEAAALMEGNHEQAYTILESLDTVTLNRREAARYSLLKSMALDKKYIDLTTDSLIAPAVKYFARHGSADDKLKTAYYHARILENAGESDAALDMIIRGEQFTKKAKDHLFAGRYYIKKSQLYSDKFEWDKALNASLAAEQHSRMVDDYRGLATALLSCSSKYRILNEKDSAYFYLAQIEPVWDKINDYRKGQYYRLLLTYSMLDGKPDVDSIYSECLSSGISPANQPYIAYTDYHISKGDPEAALEALNTSVSYGQEVFGSKEYEHRHYMIDSLSGDYQNAMVSMSRLLSERDKYESSILSSDARILEERIIATRNEVAATYRFWITTFFFILLTLTAFLVIIQQGKRQHQMHRALQEARKEKLELEKLLESGTQISEEMAELLSDRIKALNDVLIGRMTDSQRLARHSRSTIDSLVEDRDGFIISLAMQYSLSHPDFVRFLKKHDLTTWEIGFCCLYLLGLNGKDIAGYVFSSNNAYNYSSLIRQKFGLSKFDTTLSKYIRTLFEQYQCMSK